MNLHASISLPTSLLFKNNISLIVINIGTCTMQLLDISFLGFDDFF